jgi:lantibiotic leader peptide-processing serine protease
MHPHSNGLARSYIYWSTLSMAVTLALSVLLVLWSTLPVQAQSESTDDDTGDAPAQGESTEIYTGDESPPTREHLIVFSETDTLPTDTEQRIADLGGRVERQYPEIGVAVASGLSEDAAESLESFEDVQAVDADVERQWLDPQVEEPLVEPLVEEASSTEVEPANPTNPKDAFYYGRQWNLRAVKADKAWDAGRLGSPEVSVAILDSGIDANHPDLQGRVDESRSIDLRNSTLDNAIRNAFFPTSNPWTDLNGHGTHVAATVSSNAKAAAGVTSQVTLMAVKALDTRGKGSTTNVLDGLIYAVDHKADVINMSLGSTFRKSEEPGHVAALNRFINYAHRSGAVIVVAAGNDEHNLNSDSDTYLAYCQSPNVVCVSATGPTSSGSLNRGPWNEVDTRAPYSNYGSPITVAAPGGTGTSGGAQSSNPGGFVWAACSKTSVDELPNRPNSFRKSVCTNDTKPEGPVRGSNGTSMATPHVSGLAALLVKDIGKDKPSEVAAQVRKSVDDLGKHGKDGYYGHGRINVAKSIQ